LISFDWYWKKIRKYCLPFSEALNLLYFFTAILAYGFSFCSYRMKVLPLVIHKVYHFVYKNQIFLINQDSLNSLN